MFQCLDNLAIFRAGDFPSCSTLSAERDSIVGCLMTTGCCDADEQLMAQVKILYQTEGLSCDFDQFKCTADAEQKSADNTNANDVDVVPDISSVDVGMVAGAVVGGLAALLLLGGVVRHMRRQSSSSSLEQRPNSGAGSVGASGQGWVGVPAPPMSGVSSQGMLMGPGSGNFKPGGISVSVQPLTNPLGKPFLNPPGRWTYFLSHVQKVNSATCP